MTRDDRSLTEDDVWQEHQSSVKPAAHWAYQFRVLGGTLALMLALIALLGAR